MRYVYVMLLLAIGYCTYATDLPESIYDDHAKQLMTKVAMLADQKSIAYSYLYKYALSRYTQASQLLKIRDTVSYHARQELNNPLNAEWMYVVTKFEIDNDPSARIRYYFARFVQEQKVAMIRHMMGCYPTNELLFDFESDYNARINPVPPEQFIQITGKLRSEDAALLTLRSSKGLARSIIRELYRLQYLQG